jgi:hypothetical protein
MHIKEIVTKRLTATSPDGKITYCGVDSSWVTRWGSTGVYPSITRTWTLIDPNDPTLPQEGWFLSDEAGNPVAEQ